MILGGIPGYLAHLEAGRSLAQNIDRLLFAEDAVLQGEFKRLFSSAFSSPEALVKTVEVLGRWNEGFTRSEILAALKQADGGAMTERLNALVDSDLVTSHVPFGLARSQVHFKLADPFSLFWLHFRHKMDGRHENFWETCSSSPVAVIRRNFAFERLCLRHVRQIKKALEIGGVEASVTLLARGEWAEGAPSESKVGSAAGERCESGESESSENGMGGREKDLLIARKDKVVNLCVLRFGSDAFEACEDCFRSVLRRQGQVASQISRRKAVQSILITSLGLKLNEYSGVFSEVITLDDLFVAG